MKDFPSFNYQSIYFFLLSLYGIIFVLSLTDALAVENVASIRFASFINICSSLIAWLFDIYALHVLKNVYLPYDSDYKIYRRYRLGIFLVVIFLTSLIMLIALLMQ